MKILNKTKGLVVADKVETAETFFARLLGLIPKRKISAGEGMFFPDCSMIHTCFMKFPIDVVFLDESGRVLRVERSIAPWRFSKGDGGAFSVLELKAGGADGKADAGDVFQLF